MEYHYSDLLDPSEYETDGLCDGLPVRKHVAADLEEIGAFKAQEDWRDLVAPLSNYKGSLGPKFNVLAVCLPECLPDRLEILAYANEFAFLHDDIIDTSNQQERDIQNDKVSEAFREGARTGKIDITQSGERQMQANILNTMMSIDRPRALAAILAWAKFLEQGTGRQPPGQFQTLEEYLPYRAKDIGYEYHHALITFGCGITVPEEERGICKELAAPAAIAASLTNDLFSYEGEYEAAQTAGLPGFTNALCVLMDEHNISLEEAKAKCRARIKEEVAKYARNVRDTMSRNDLSSDAKRYIDLMQYSYNERQTMRARDGVAKHPTTYQLTVRTGCSRLGTDEMSIPDLKVRTAVSPDLSDEGLGQSVSPTEPPDSPLLRSKEGHDWDLLTMTRSTRIPKLGEDLLSEPYRYISSLPSKGVRDMVNDGLQFWLGVSPQSAAIIKQVVKMIHNSSLMIDDIQDGSELRRGKPSAHVVFGEGVTINSAQFQYMQAFVEVRKLNNPLCIDIFLDETRNLLIGQGLDLHWTSRVQCPSVPEYLQMIDGKTGGLFRLLVRLMAAESPYSDRGDMDQLCRLLTRYYQIRDDYQNLVSEEYTAKKGFCEDLDEGKLSLPLIHALTHTNKPLQLTGLLHERRRKGHCTVAQKHSILALMREAGSLDYVSGLLRALYAELEAEVGRLESVFGQVNDELRLMLSMIKL